VGHEEAIARYRLGRYQEALDLVATANDLQGIWLRARCLLALAKALEAWPLLKALPDGHEDVWVERGLCLDRLGRPADAKTCYERANPNSPRRWCHLARHDAVHAREYFLRALQGFKALEQAGALDQRTSYEYSFTRERLSALEAARTPS
jgi:tetratricopeptide (TPR) repeat protein